MLLALSLATAGPVFGTVDAPVRVDLGGNWARLAPAASGWWFFYASGGDYRVVPMTDAFATRYDDVRGLTGHTDLKDNQIVPCPDGRWMHGASADLEMPADTAYLFWYDADFQLVEERILAERETTLKLNDPALLCSEAAVLYGAVDESYDSVVFEIEAEASTLVEVDELPFLQGGSLVWEAERGTLAAIGGGDGDPHLVRTDLDYGVVESRPLGVAVKGERAYWPQAVARVGDTWILAHMSRVDGAGWAVDTGNVWLAAFDLDWNLLDHVQLTTLSPPTGAMRPGLAVKGDQLVVSYDLLSEIWVQSVSLRPVPDDTGTTDTAGIDTGDPVDTAPTDTDTPGGDDSGPASGEDDTGKPADAGGCGCAAGSPAGVGGVLLAIGATIGGRRRRPGDGRRATRSPGAVSRAPPRPRSTRAAGSG